MSVRLRRPAHRGSVLASGLVVDARVVGEETARARVLTVADGGADVHRVGTAFVVRFATPMRLVAEEALGAPLVRFGRVESTAPLDADETRALEGIVGPESVVLVVGGIASAVTLRTDDRVDVAAWIDVGSFTLEDDVTSLGTAPPSPTTAVERIEVDVAGALAVGGADAATKAVIAELEKPEAGAASLLARIAFAVERLLRWLVGSAPDNGGTHARAESWVRRTLARLLVWSRLATILSRRHTAYLQRTLDMFAKGDFDEALRHAVPLSDGVSRRLRMLGSLRPRADLAIQSTSRVDGAVGFGGGVFEHLRMTYRRAFDALVARGDIERAAFVLAELLRANEEAVLFLERNGRLDLAARLAEGRKLAPGIVVGQWFLAGDTARAIRIARQTGAFADAVLRLERRRRAEADVLRLSWANELAESGAYAAAVDAAWKLPSARGLVDVWIDQCLALGGEVGARMLVRKAIVRPDCFDEVRARADDLVACADVPALRGMGNELELTTQESSPATRSLAHMAGRELLASATDDDVALALRLIEAAGDTILAADARAAKAKAKPRSIEADVYGATGTGTKSRDKVGYIGVGFGGTTLLGTVNGMSGLDASAVAESLPSAVNALLPTTARGDVRAVAAAIRSALDAVQRRIRGSRDADDWSPPGGSVTLAMQTGRALLVAQLGDTRGYVLRDGTLVQVTREHTLRQRWIDEGATSPDPERQAPHVLVRAIEQDGSVACDFWSLDLHANDVVLLCNRGFYSVVDDLAIAPILQSNAPRAACDALLALARERGATDDFAVVVATFRGGSLGSSIGQPIRALAIEPAAPSPAPSTMLHRHTADAGALTVRDAAELPDGRLLVALGELGVRLVSREGKTLAQFAEPTERLVLSDHGDRAILVARRGEVCRLGLLDLVTRRVRPWSDARIDSFASRFDGSTWLVSSEDALFAIDARSSGWEHLWQYTNGEGKIWGELVSTPTAFCVSFSDSPTTPSTLSVFESQGAEAVLRRRLRFEPPPLVRMAVAERGTVAAWRSEDDRSVACWRRGEEMKDLELTIGPSEHAGEVWATEQECAFVVHHEEGLRIHVFGADGGARTVLKLDGARSATLRFPMGPRVTDSPRSGNLVVSDARGRVIVLSPDMAVVRELRIS